jgi:hypothetical protein
MKRIVRLTESDLSRIVKRVIKEQYHEKPLIFESTGLGWCSMKYPGKTEEYKKCIEADKVWVNSDYHLVPTDSKTLGEASRIIGELLKAFQGRGTDDTAARKAIYSINSKELYYAVLWKLQHSPTVKSIMGYNYNLVGDFLSTDMSYTQHAMPYQTVFGLSNKQYLDYERHLKQFNKDEEIKRDKRFIGWN